ncbi:MAG: acyl-CoA dehydrogenase [Alphaproteobacteria bacterium]|nr:acyl-CoA dehydrogenase [Alphaproteobacteria bacterium]
MSYQAPIDEMHFALEAIVGIEALAETSANTPDPETFAQVLEAAGTFATDELAPLNAAGDRSGAHLENGVVRTAPGFAMAYRRFVENGWNGLPFAESHGGQALPWSMAVAVQEMWQSANMSFGLCPLLTQGAVELLAHHGTAGQKEAYLSRLVSGEWTGTMNLTEPQAGSDVGALRTRAQRAPEADGRLGEAYRIKGTKIFITYGEHDMTDNIVHMVLARVPGAPPGPKGISLFLVPKFLPGAEDGALGERNDVRCVSLEHKLGINASPTCVMAYGDSVGALGWRIGAEGKGLECMFTMMNNARLAVGLQGVAIAERACQAARTYAATRIQGRAIGENSHLPAHIDQHPDVRRMLLDMRAKTEAARALAYSAHLSLDLAAKARSDAVRRHHQARVDLLTPVVKAWATDIGCDVASTGVQIHGGMGYIEETGAAQHLRDARIAPIYEGTNGIQANDLVFRKIARDGGASAREFLKEILDTQSQISASQDEDLRAIAERLAYGREALSGAVESMLNLLESDQRAAAAAAAPFLNLFGVIAGAALLAKGAAAAAKRLADGTGAADFLRSRISIAGYFAHFVVPLSTGHLHAIRFGAPGIARLSEARL